MTEEEKSKLEWDSRNHRATVITDPRQ